MRDEKTKTVKVFDREVKGSKTMVTEYTVLRADREKGLALVEVNLITGRTHQIRAHLAHEGYPLLGDGKYGRNVINKQYNLKTQALCSYKLAFEFRTDAGSLKNLNNRTFEVEKVWFLEK